jgi:hypothetical protein
MTDDPLVMTRTRFAGPPAPDPMDPATTTLSPNPVPEDPEVRGPVPGRTAAAATGTSTTSSAGSGRAEVAAGMAQALTGLLVMVMVGVRWLVRHRGVEVRPMTRVEREAVAAPLSRIGSRHIPIELAPAVIKDIADVSETAGAVSAYLDAGAITRPGAGHLPPQPQETE